MSIARFLAWADQGGIVGTRHFYPVEKKDSRIKWERADVDTAKKLASAIHKNSYGTAMIMVARIVVLFPFAILLTILVMFLGLLKINYARIVNDTEIVVYIFYAACILFFLVFLVIRYMKMRPYLYPARQKRMWIFRTKCASTSVSGMRRNDYYANFQRGGDHICIQIQWPEYQANPKGKEYIFYKFNDRVGNRWAAIAADRLDEV